MTVFDDLAHNHTTLDGAELQHLQRLVTSWSLLADLCFADLLLFAPIKGGNGESFVVSRRRVQIACGTQGILP